MRDRKTILDVSEFENGVRNETENVVLVSHNFSHLRRTAQGSHHLVDATGGDLQQQLVVYVASLVHDFNRPNSEIIDHGSETVVGAENFLKNWDCLGHEKKILRMVDDHNRVIDGSVYDRALFISDKVLEAMGAYVAFRACVYAAEIDSFEGQSDVELAESTYGSMSNRMGLFTPNKFPKEVQPLARRQSDWIWHFLQELKGGKEWAGNLATKCFEYGRNIRQWDISSPKPSFEDMLYNYVPESESEVRYKHEAMRYLTEPLYIFCHNLVDTGSRTIFGPAWRK